MNRRIGVLAGLREGHDCFTPVKDFGLDVCQLVSWDPELWSGDTAKLVRQQAERAGVRITAFWAGWTGKKVWDFIEGPSTLGIVPRRFRRRRLKELWRGVDFANALGLPAIVTHLGFLPENANDPLFHEAVRAVMDLAGYLHAQKMELWLETGQETPVTMLRLIEAIGLGNVAVNLDPANLILYGKASPIDALQILGHLVRNVHAKDGLYPTDPMKLGQEVKVGQGSVRFPDFVRSLESAGFRGEYIVEREITGVQQDVDIRETVSYLDALLQEVAR